MKTKTFTLLMCMLFFSVLQMQGQTTTYTANSNGYAYIDNGTYKVGFRLDYGGAIDWISKSNEDISFVNSFDNGRQIVIDAYTGPYYNQTNLYSNQGFIDPCSDKGVLCSEVGPSWNGLPQGNYSGLLGGQPNSVNWNSGTQKITIESKLWDWSMLHASDKSIIYDQAEQTQEVEFVASNIIKVVITTNTHIDYITDSFMFRQMSPVMFLNGEYTKGAFYNGSSPFTSDPNINNAVLPYRNPDFNYLNNDAKEKWAGLYNTSDYGIGMVWKDNETSLVAGTHFPSRPNNGRREEKASYLYHINNPQWSKGTQTFVNEFYLVIGSPTDARCFSYSLNGYSSSCSSAPSCDFTPSVATSNANPTAGSNINLSYSCSGGDCSGVSYSWSGHGISGTGSPLTIAAPATEGVYTYTVTASKSGCSNKSVSTTITVPSTSGSTTTCVNLNDLCSGNASEVRDYTLSMSAAGNYPLKVNYKAHEKPSVLRMKINGGAWQNFNVSQTSTGQFVNTILGSFMLNAGSNAVSFASGDGYICFRELCAIVDGCTTPSAPTVSASPTTIISGESSILTATGCSGSVVWSNGATGATTSVSPTTTTSYTATCTIGTCASTASSNATVTVSIPGGTPNCSSLEGFFDAADCGTLKGWIYDYNSPNSIVTVDVYEGSTLIQGNISANIFRQDLLDANKGNGVHGFEINTPTSLKDGQSHSLTLKVTGCSSYSPNNSPRTISGCTGGCTAPSAPSLSASPSTIDSGSSTTLSASGCSGVVTWSDGLGTGSSKTVSPTTSKTYTATCTVDGCHSSSASVTVTVQVGSSSYSQCLESESSSGNGSVTTDPNASNGETRGSENNYDHYVDYALTSVPSAGTYYVTLRYYSSSAPTVSVQVNSETPQTVYLANSGSWNIVPTTQTFAVSLASGSNTVRIHGTGGGSCRQDKICVSNENGSSAVLNSINPDEFITENKNLFSVMPNPNKGIFDTRFFLDRGKKGTLTVSDLHGRILYRKTITGNGWQRERINLMNKASGMLLLQLDTKTGKQAVKKINIIR